MIAGRIVWGIAQVILMGLSGGTFTFQIFITQALLNAIPAIILQLIIVPAIVAALRRARLIRKSASFPKVHSLWDGLFSAHRCYKMLNY